MRIKVVVVQILIGIVDLTPPPAKTSSGLAHGDVGVEDHPNDAMLARPQAETHHSLFTVAKKAVAWGRCVLVRSTWRRGQDDCENRAPLR